MPITHRQIEVFQAIMRAGNVTRAAQSLHTSQPTLSRELARLEQVLQFPLFERAHGRLHATARALVLMEEVQRSYQGLERIATTAQSLRSFSGGRLSLTCLPALAQSLLPGALSLFAQKFPQVGVSLLAQESPTLEQSLTEQRFDLGLCEHGQTPAATTSTALLQADEVCVLPSGHPLLQKRKLRPTDFADQAFISYAPTDPYRQQVDAWFEQHGVQRRLGLETDSAATVCALVKQGLGVAIVNPLTAWELAGIHLHVRPLSVSIPFSVALVQPLYRPSNPLVESFAQCLRQHGKLLQSRLRKGDFSPLSPPPLFTPRWGEKGSPIWPRV